MCLRAKGQFVNERASASAIMAYTVLEHERLRMQARQGTAINKREMTNEVQTVARDFLPGTHVGVLSDIGRSVRRPG